MIDVEMIERAEIVYPFIKNVEIGYDNYIRELKKSFKEQDVFKGFSNNKPFEVEVHNKYFKISFYKGDFNIKKLLLRGKMYGFKYPFQWNGSLIAIYDKKMQLKAFSMKPLNGFHFVSDDLFGYYLCLGDLRVNLDSYKSLTDLEKLTPSLLSLWETVNINSLGAIIFDNVFEDYNKAMEEYHTSDKSSVYWYDYFIENNLLVEII